MSGLEVVGLVAAIVAAYSGTASFLIARKKRKQDKACRVVEAREKLGNAVALAPRQIQAEYDQDLSRIGRNFAVGDSITRGQLTAVLINMQRDMIQKLQEMLLAGAPDQNIDYELLFGVSEVSRNDSIASLAQQYQRFCCAAPISRPISGSSFAAPTFKGNQALAADSGYPLEALNRTRILETEYKHNNRVARGPTLASPISRPKLNVASNLSDPRTISNPQPPMPTRKLLDLDPTKREARLVPFWQCTQCRLMADFSGLQRQWTDTKDLSYKKDVSTATRHVSPKMKQTLTRKAKGPPQCCFCSTGSTIAFKIMTTAEFLAYEARRILDGELYLCTKLVPRSDCGDPFCSEDHVYGPHYRLPASPTPISIREF